MWNSEKWTKHFVFKLHKWTNTYWWWSNFTDSRLFCNWTYFGDVAQRILELLPWRLENGTLRRRYKLVPFHCPEKHIISLWNIADSHANRQFSKMHRSTSKRSTRFLSCHAILQNSPTYEECQRWQIWYSKWDTFQTKSFCFSKNKHKKVQRYTFTLKM